jgi:hypothetical protein
MDEEVGSPPYHDWRAVSDTALLPPPPILGHQTSPSGNTTLEAALRAHEWCEKHPLSMSSIPKRNDSDEVQQGMVELVRPFEYTSKLQNPRPGYWTGVTDAKGGDCCLLTSSPLYLGRKNGLAQTKASSTIYFEVSVKSLGRGPGGDAGSLAIGFCALPYPTWRMPGWERGSLAVHTDDGRRYVNDTDGGKDFVARVQAGETIGLGITYDLDETSGLAAEVFFTRNGRKAAGWNLNEEIDSENEHGILGLDGRYDLHGAIGVFGAVKFEVEFNSDNWL